MGFPLVCYCFAVPKPLIAFCKLLSAIRDAVLLMLAVVGLCHFPHDGSADGPQPEEVKRQLPAVEYGRLVAEQSSLMASSPSKKKKQAPPCHDGGEAALSSSATCIVCLERLVATDEVRRLGSCAHAFHRGCIDRWIDLGRITCPLCRSSLLPRARGGGPLGLGRLTSLLSRGVW